MKYLNLQNIWKRLKSDSPTYFKQLIKLCLALAAAGGALIGLKEVEQTAKYIAFVPDAVGGYLILAGVVAAFVSKMTVTDSAKQTEEIK